MIFNPPLSPDEKLLSQHQVCAFGNVDAPAQLFLTNRSLKLVFFLKHTSGDQVPIVWNIRFSDITQMRFKQDSTKVAVALSIVSKVSVCGKVPIERRDSAWLYQNREAIKRKAVGVREISDRHGRQDGAFSYRLPEGWFFDESGCCLSVYLTEMGPEEACKLSARIFAIRDTGMDSESYFVAEGSKSGLLPWLSAEEPQVLKRWEGASRETPWWGVPGTFILRLFFSIRHFAPAFSLTKRRLIAEYATQNRIFELSEFPIDTIRSLCWLMRGSSTKLMVLSGAPTFDSGYQAMWDRSFMLPASEKA